MTTATNSVSDPLAGLRATTPGAQPKSLGQDDFLKLMLTQLKNQDPTKPLDNSQFLGQMAQFSTVSGIQELQKSFETLSASLQSGQTLQAVGLVGRSAMVASDTAPLAGSGGVTGALELPAGAADVVVEITDASGAVVRRMDLGAQPAGAQPFSWDGNDDTGQRLPAGVYGITALGLIGGTAQSLATRVAARIDSVTLGGSGGLTLNLDHIGPTPLSAVSQFL